MSRCFGAVTPIVIECPTTPMILAGVAKRRCSARRLSQRLKAQKYPPRSQSSADHSSSQGRNQKAQGECASCIALLPGTARRTEFNKRVDLQLRPRWLRVARSPLSAARTAFAVRTKANGKMDISGLFGPPRTDNG